MRRLLKAGRRAALLLLTLHLSAASSQVFVARGGSEHAGQTLTGSICKVDYSESPGLQALAGEVLRVCETNYPKIKKILAAGEQTAPKQVLIIFKKDQQPPGLTRGAEITLSEKYFTKNPGDLGAVVHEVAHVAQGYTDEYLSSWLTEGIADYVRYALGYQSASSYPHCTCADDFSPHYTSGYWCSAAFLGYITKRYDRQFVANLDRAIRDGSYRDMLCKTGFKNKSMEQLWRECQLGDCAVKNHPAVPRFNARR